MQKIKYSGEKLGNIG